MTHGQGSHGHEQTTSKEDPSQPHTSLRPPDPKKDPASFCFSHETDAKLGNLLDTLILKALRSMETASMGAIQEKLGTIETAITNLTSKTERFMATTQELLSRLDTRTSEMAAQETEMAVDIQLIKDRLQALIDGSTDLNALKAGVQDILDSKIEPLAAQHTATAAELDAMGKDPNNPFPPADPNAPQFARGSGARTNLNRQPGETDAQFTTRTGEVRGAGNAGNTGNRGDAGRQSNETDEQFRARTGNAGNAGNAGRQPGETVEEFNRRRARGG